MTTEQKEAVAYAITAIDYKIARFPKKRRTLDQTWDLAHAHKARVALAKLLNK